MIPSPFDYAIPTSLDEAVALLNEHRGARVLAGGQTLLTRMKMRQEAPSLLVDLNNLPDLRIMGRYGDGAIHVGAMTTLVEMLEARDVLGDYTALREAIQQTGDPQMRNRATFGGTLIDNQPGVALHAAALVFELTFSILGPAGTTSLPASALIADGFQSMTPGAIMTAVGLPTLDEKSGSAYETFNARASGRSICGVAVYIVRAPDGSLSQCRVAVTGATRYAQRLPAVEAALIGKQPTAEQIQAAVAASSGSAKSQVFISDLLASAEYRAHLTAVLAARALARAVSRTTQAIS